MTRPASIQEIAQRTAIGMQPFDVAIREFLDHWQSLSVSEKEDAIAKEPIFLDVIRDAYLGALAEHLSLSEHLTVPQWAENSRRFLTTPYFAGGLESLKACLLVESPLAFRRRLIFISANALSRPRRDFIQENALNVANLDV